VVLNHLIDLMGQNHQPIWLNLKAKESCQIIPVEETLNALSVVNRSYRLSISKEEKLTHWSLR